MASPRPTHELFNEEYENKGLQPTYKTTVGYKKAANDTDEQVTDSANTYTADNDNYSYDTRVRQPNINYRKRPPIKLKRKLPTKAKLAKKGFAYTRVTATNISIITWGMTLWWLQLVLALISVVALAGLGIWENVSESSGLLKFVVNGVEEVYDGIAELSKDLGIATLPQADDLKGMMVATVLLPAAVGVLTLFLATIQYIFLRFRPLFGEGSALKISAFLVAILGYCIPIANIFPWFILWVLAVWRYPK